MANGLIAVIDKNKAEDMRIELMEFRGYQLIGIRVFVDTPDSEDRVPTRKGVTFRQEQLPELIAALKQAAAILEVE
jgi:hypothetical protein